jgi:DNA invertase Pin-like site-specific DNA recombinase
MGVQPHSRLTQIAAYYRVSTDRHGRSGLGLEAQQKAVQAYLNGGDRSLVAELTEVETGTCHRRCWPAPTR